MLHVTRFLPSQGVSHDFIRVLLHALLLSFACAIHRLNRPILQATLDGTCQY